MSNWRPLFGRITFITNAAVAPQRPASSLSLYQKMWETVPQNLQEPSSLQAASNAQGVKGPFAYACSVAANRIDFTVLPSAAVETPANMVLPVVEDAASFRTELRMIIERYAAGRVSIPESLDRPRCSSNLYTFTRRGHCEWCYY